MTDQLPGKPEYNSAPPKLPKPTRINTDRLITDDPLVKAGMAYSEPMEMIREVMAQDLDPTVRADLMKTAKGKMDAAFGKLEGVNDMGTSFDDIYFLELNAAVIFAFPQDQKELELVYRAIEEEAEDDLREKYIAVKKLPDMSGRKASLLAFIGRKDELGAGGRPENFDVTFDVNRTKQAVERVAKRLEGWGSKAMADKLRAIDLSHLEQLNKKR